MRLEFIITRFGDKTIKCKEIHSEGKQFDIGDGKKFNSVEDLINYYKKNLLTVSGGARILLDKVDLYYNDITFTCKIQETYLIHNR